jgi:hypothetical protein
LLNGALPWFIAYSSSLLPVVLILTNYYILLQLGGRNIELTASGENSNRSTMIDLLE